MTSWIERYSLFRYSATFTYKSTASRNSCLRDELIWGVGNVDGAGAEQDGFSPVGEARNVSGEFGGHRGDTGNSAKFDERDFQREFAMGVGRDGGFDIFA